MKTRNQTHGRISRRTLLKGGAALFAGAFLTKLTNNLEPRPGLTQANTFPTGDELLSRIPNLSRFQAATNPIVKENLQPGSSDWQINNYTPEEIEGFASTTSVNLSETINFFVNTPASRFDLFIYRTGYYNGLGGRLMAEARDLVGVVQPKPYYDWETGLASCSHWSVSHSLTIPEDWVSGVYLAKLVRADTGGENYILFVVRNDAHKADILFQQSVTTYQAYNNYYGKSIYDFNSVGCETVAGTTRAVKVSFDRPYTSPHVYYGNTYFWSDYPMVYWLEAQGYDIAYSTNIDTHRSGKPDEPNKLLDHRVFLVVGHDEYWTQEMRDAITAARDAGVHLGFFSSNTGYWRVRLEPDPQTGEPERVLVCYKTSESGPPDPSGHATTLWREPQTINDPENALIGIQYLGDNDIAFFPLRVTAELAQDRLYRHTGLQEMKPGAYVDIGKNLVGWEWDAVTDNGHTPENLVILAASPVYGVMRNNPANYHHAPIEQSLAHTTRYVAPSGAIVFASGTNLWAWGLALVEPNECLQQITCNLLADMGVYPITAAPTLILDDQTPQQNDKSNLSSKVIFFSNDNQDPAILKLQQEVTDTTIVVSWETERPTRGQIWVRFSTEKDDWLDAIIADTHHDDFTNSHQLTIPNLVPNTAYSFRIAAADAQGKVSISAVSSFQTKPTSLLITTKEILRASYRSVRCWAQID
jgi:hypothetical protein